MILAGTTSAFAQGKRLPGERVQAITGAAEDQPRYVVVGDQWLEAGLIIGDGRGTEGAMEFPVMVTQPWPGGALPILFDTDISQEQRDRFFRDCALWLPHAGVRCVPHRDETRFVVVLQSEEGCFASIGAPARASGVGFINLGDGCWHTDVIAHEVGHVLGMMHEHQRPDRDDYIVVRMENVEEGKEHNFTKYSTTNVRTSYDFDSLMHYHPTSFSKDDSSKTMEALPQYADAARRMGLALAPSGLDMAAIAHVYNQSPREGRGSSSLRFDRQEFLRAMFDLDVTYRTELQRSNGLSLGARPDFLGIAAWIFDVYLASRASGMDQGDSFRNVRAWISQTGEWRDRNPGRNPLTPVSPRSPIVLDRGEYLDAMYRLDEAYRTELRRANGLSIDGRPDFLGIAAWIFDVYLNARLGGESPNAAWSRVLTAIRNSDEYRRVQ